MTTILADFAAGVMVCDSKCSTDATWYPMTKVHRIEGELIGVAGNVKDGQAWLKWYRGGKRGARPKVESFAALILRDDGLYEACSDGLEIRVERGFHGVGSGGACALAALMAGADPIRAVEIACAIDTGSGGEIHTHRLKP